MKSIDNKITSVVSRFAILVASVVAVALPLGYAGVAYESFSAGLDFKAKVKATAIERLVATTPEMWMFAENRLQGLLEREPVRLESEAVQVFDARGELVAEAGTAPMPPLVRRSHMIYDASRAAGRVEVRDSARGIIYGVVGAALAGLLLGGLVFLALRTLPLRALRRVTRDLFDQKQRAEVTLRSIGDGVITTDAQTRVEFMNPVAQTLCGWTFDEARYKPLAEILQLFDAASGAPVVDPLGQALAENRIVVAQGDLTLVRRDGSSLSIDNNAAPICDSEGEVTGGVLTLRDVSVARGIAQQRSWEASHDTLTGLVNRREFESLLAASLASTRADGLEHVVCYMDLDQFKVVNDTCGHAAGDDLLKEVGQLLRSQLRKFDTLARLGGDEFGLLLWECSLENAQIIAADLLATVGRYRLTRDTKVFTVGVSIGLAPVTADCISSAEVLGMADTACYWAKEQGRNRVSVYRAGESEMAVRRREMNWIARINAALAEDRFVLYHQTYLQLTNPHAASCHLEVLIRMIDEGGNLIQPGNFLPAAERYNLMPAIDRWVIGAVFSGYRSLVEQRGEQPLTCAINLSGTSLNDEGFVEFVRQQAHAHALPRHSICFEITESAAINNLTKAAAFMAECRALGFLFALDDFGTGTSSFAYLKNLPVDYLKIDGSFVKNMESDAVDKAMTETINRIGHIMGIKTIAEYAENAEIIEELRALGVDYAQGYGVCMPSPLFAQLEHRAEL
ncbi:EAL domain-containing protein [Variovorax sp. LT1R16]|uniref:EAL domain-containing protein n=1 Tax=Variovorax sp. LT1R16 TaxID=3443728 RepID=UPI003F4510B0